MEEWIRGLPAEWGYWFVFFLAEEGLRYALKHRAKWLPRRPKTVYAAALLRGRGSLQATATVLKPLSITANIETPTVVRGRAPLSVMEDLFWWWVRGTLS
jgi:hypothetical protein